jgi:hypothetical protein
MAQIGDFLPDGNGNWVCIALADSGDAIEYGNERNDCFEIVRQPKGWAIREILGGFVRGTKGQVRQFKTASAAAIEADNLMV